MRSILPVVVSNVAGQIRHVLTIIYDSILAGFFSLPPTLILFHRPNAQGDFRGSVHVGNFSNCWANLVALKQEKQWKCVFQKLLTGAYSAAPRSLDRQESTTVMEFCTNFTDNIVFSLVIQCDGTRKNNMKPSRLWSEGA